MSIKILLLEDDLLFGETIVDLLEDEDFEVIHTTNGQDALDATFHQKFDLYLLDINVPLVNGISFLSELRAVDDATPAIFLTSYSDKDTLADAFVSGADDFISKPVDNRELILRLNAVLRRTQGEKKQCLGRLCYDKHHKTISYDGERLELSNKEYHLLVLLMDNANQVVPKELIYNELWSSAESGGSDGAIRVYINRLKQLLEDFEIENIRGIGYKLVS